MKILIIEDDLHKLRAIETFIFENYPMVPIEKRMSYQSGLITILRESYELILLDMQLPTYDIKSGEDGYKPRAMAGRDILREIIRKKINSKVAIITQYESFGENGRFESLREWDAKFKKDFHGVYLTTIQYKPGSDSWKDLLKRQIEKFYK